MKFVKCLLVALTLWMPISSFAAALGSPRHIDQTAPCEEPAHEESCEPEQSEPFLLSSVIPCADPSTHIVHHESHLPLDGHIAELHCPPPNFRA